MPRAAIDATCRQCHAHVLVGYDADVAALVVTVDNAPLTRTGELLAAVAGRVTYNLDTNGRLDHRRRWRLRRPAAGQVLTDHLCDQPLPETWLQPPAPKPSRPNTQEVPF